MLNNRVKIQPEALIDISRDEEPISVRMGQFRHILIVIFFF